MRLVLIAVAAGAAYFFYQQRQRFARSRSTTNASDAVDNIHLPKGASADQHLDAGVQETFPASDPVSVSAKGETEWERQQRRKKTPS